jgi:LysR family transcriptional regulator for bpeEF and oprC
VNETGLYIKMCLAGFGLAQLAENIVADHLRETGGSADGLAAAPVPVTLLYPHQRFLSPAVRAFAEWMSEVV